MKLKFLIFNCSFLILTACGAQKPLTTSHIERIETQLKPVAVGADTIELEISSTAGSQWSTDNRHRPDFLEETDRVAIPGFFRSGDRQDAASFEGAQEPRCVPTMRSVASTRALRVETQHTDSTMRIKLMLHPDTVFVPYIHHIRSDTIVVPDPVTEAKLRTARWQIVVLILIIIVATIIFLFKQKYRFLR